jgi:uncharacterized protein YndB with AHSA1/START domain
VVVNNVIPFRPLRRRPPWPHTDWLTAYVRFWNESLDRLAAYIEQLKTEERAMSDVKFDYPKEEPSMICTRSFDAPVSMVWKVFTDPVHVARWWGPKSFAPVKKVDKLELRPGGQWRYVCEQVRTGQEIVFAGKYLEVVTEKKVVNTFGVEGQFEGDDAFPETHTFEERGGRTYYRSYSLMPNFEARDAIIATGMEAGGRESLEQLGDVVDELMKETV